MGGRIETATAAGQGTSFKLRAAADDGGDAGRACCAAARARSRCRRRWSRSCAARRRGEVERGLRRAARYAFGDHDAAVLLARRAAAARHAARRAARRARAPIVVVRSAQQRIALHVDEVLGNQEVVVKNLGPQLSRLPGLAGHDAARLGRGRADLQPGGAGDALWRRGARGDAAAQRRRRCRRRAGRGGRRARKRAAGPGGRRFADRAPRHAAPAACARATA